jgi:hypothetical protein
MAVLSARRLANIGLQPTAGGAILRPPRLKPERYADDAKIRTGDSS